MTRRHVGGESTNGAAHAPGEARAATAPGRAGVADPQPSRAGADGIGTAGIEAPDEITSFIRAEHVALDAPVPAGARRAAVLGSPIEHSLSPRLHRAAYASLGLTHHRYDKFEVREGELAAVIDRLGPAWTGLSLTMPLKRVVIPLLDEITPLAAAVGAVNTLVFGDGDVHGLHDLRPRRGDNTDVAGLVGAFGEVGLSSAPAGREATSRAVILGGGATAASAVAAFGQLGWRRVTLAARSRERAEDVCQAGERLGIQVEVRPLDEAVSVLADATAVVATVPADVLSNLQDALHLDLSVGATPPVLLDAIYDPWPTPIAAAWQRVGGRVISGKQMLIHQAVGQVRQMTGHEPALAVLQAAAS
ncbi:MAG: shikimate dehydrogenase [Actinomycetales bacterium]